MNTKNKTTATKQKNLRIQIKDLPKDMKLSDEELESVKGGPLLQTSLSASYYRAPIIVSESGGHSCGCG